MNIKTDKIYFALHPPTEKEIPSEEKEQYLQCKLWKLTKREADLFYVYYPGSVYGELHRIVGILSGWILKKDDLMKAYGQITKLYNAYRYGNDKVKRHLDKFPVFKKILEAMTQDTSYPRDNLIDDVLDWSLEKELLDAPLYDKTKKIITETRAHLFANGDTTPETRIEILKILCHERSALMYEDAKELLFSDQDLLPELSEAINKREILAKSSTAKDTYYFDIRSLIKWLIKNKSVATEIIKELHELEVEAAKENLVEYKGKLNSLSKSIKNGHDRNDLLTDALDGGSTIFLKYPRSYLKWRDNRDINKHKNVESSFAPIRYDGLGQLKTKKTEDTFQCQFGGLTVDMLVFEEAPRHHLSPSIPKSVYEIEIVPTEAEYNAGLQPYIEIPPDKIDQVLTDNNLILFQLVTPNHTNDKQLLSRKAIKKNYPELTIDMWDKALAHDEKLVKSKIPGRTPQKDRYDQASIESWLIEEGYYTKAELKALAEPPKPMRSLVATKILNFLQMDA